jgi:hypothetical protein
VYAIKRQLQLGLYNVERDGRGLFEALFLHLLRKIVEHHKTTQDAPISAAIEAGYFTNSSQFLSVAVPTLYVYAFSTVLYDYYESELGVFNCRLVLRHRISFAALS